VGFAPLPIGRTSLSSPIHRPRSVVATTSPGIRRAVRPVPLHRPDPRRSPSRGVATASDLGCRPGRVPTSPFCTVSPVFSADGQDWVPGFPTPFSVPEDSRACCIPLPIVGFGAFRPTDRVAAGPVNPAIAGGIHRRSPRSRLPRTDVRTPRRTPPTRSRTVSPRPLPSRTWRFPPVSTVPTLPLPAAPLLPMPERCLSLRALLREMVRTDAHF
jgi:hypothetical protein